AMESISCDKYIYMSSTAIYELDHKDVREDEFDGLSGELVWCNRPDYSYSEVKRQAEYALWQKYGDRQWIAVRYPYVVGEDDYTKRLYFYVENAIKGNPMNIDNMDSQMSFIKSDEAGKFMTYLVDKDFTGPVNGCSYGTISIREILDYVEKKTGKQAVIAETGEVAPYNGTRSHSINMDKAAGLGYEFSNIKEWIYELIDRYIELLN
ncbi:MAG: NAD-dependent epimerase/dehydratase family protein, partial [Lachnospiraceae bacterium]|nr:NAD-dependent epimerase/dehydratase family protein [Lachnospiraceae bacterium]